MQLTSETISMLKKLPTGNVGDANGGMGVMDCSIRPIDSDSKLIGTALTCECAPGDNLALHQAIYAAKEGDVLVCSCQRYNHAGHFGDIMATAAMRRGLAGVVIDGSCRDACDIKAMKFPVFCSGFSPKATTKEVLAKLNIPIVCGSVLVNPGDIIFADCDGVVVVPKETADDVFKKALEKYEKEIKIKQLLEAGHTTLEIFGFDELIDRKKSLGGKT